MLSIGRDSYFVRCGSDAKKKLGLSFANEIELMRLASELNLSPSIIFADGLREIIICPFIESRPVDLHNKVNLEKALGFLKKFHTCGKELSFTVTPEDMISSYLQQIEKLNIPLSSHQRSLIASRPKTVIKEY